VAIVHVGGKTGEALSGGAAWYDGVDNTVLFAPAIKQSDKLV
jgi:hypothetical protein